jgi:hypothetical protein
MTYTLEDLGNCKTPVTTNFDKVFSLSMDELVIL